jgi:phosphate transport system substrate-binding protein
MNRNLKSLIGAMAGLAMAATAAMAADITGAGSTFVFPIVAKWAATYKGSSGVGLNYQSIGSGGGIAQIKAKTVTFGATDKPLTSKELAAAGLTQFPVVIGGIVPVVNVRGVGPGQLTLDGPTLVGIFSGKISRWDDAAIKKINPGINLPGQAIAVVHRSDGSGTTFQFSTYLSRVSADWKNSVGADTAIDWPVGIGAKGNEGVANQTLQTSGAIGYVEYAYVKQTNMTYARMINHDAKTVAPEAKAFAAAAANADWARADGYYLILTDQSGAESWPITGASFILMHADSKDANTGAALKFFDWAYKNGTKLASDLDFVPLPDAVTKLVEKTWQSSLKVNGAPAWTAK